MQTHAPARRGVERVGGLAAQQGRSLRLLVKEGAPPSRRGLKDAVAGAGAAEARTTVELESHWRFFAQRRDCSCGRDSSQAKTANASVHEEGLHAIRRCRWGSDVLLRQGFRARRPRLQRAQLAGLGACLAAGLARERLAPSPHGQTPTVPFARCRRTCQRSLPFSSPR